jgi:hypothetical protein
MSAYSIRTHMREHTRARSRRAHRITAVATIASATLFALLLGQAGDSGKVMRPDRPPCGPDSVIAAEVEGAARPTCVPSPGEIEL